MAAVPDQVTSFVLGATVVSSAAAGDAQRAYSHASRRQSIERREASAALFAQTNVAQHLARGIGQHKGQRDAGRNRQSGTCSHSDP